MGERAIVWQLPLVWLLFSRYPSPVRSWALDAVCDPVGSNAVFAAAQKGATIANYVNVNSLTKGSDGKLNGAVITDLRAGKTWTIKAKTVVNCTGPFADALRQMDNPEAERVMLPAAGVHIILPDHFSPDRYA